MPYYSTKPNYPLLTYFTTTIHIVSKESYKEERRKIRICCPRIDQLFCKQENLRRQERKVKKDNIQQWIFSNGLRYLLCLWILPCWDLQTSYNCCPISTTLIGPLVVLPATYNTSRGLPPALYYLQHPAFLHSQCLSLATVPFKLQATTCQYSPFIFYP